MKAPPDDADMMQKMGLPSAFQIQGQELDSKRDLYCELCRIQMNNYHALEAHLQGAQHLKTQQNYKLKDKIQPKSEYYITDAEGDKKFTVVIPLRLRVHLSNSL